MTLAQRAVLVLSGLAMMLLLAAGAAGSLIRSRAGGLDGERWTEEEVDRLIADQRRLSTLGVFPTGRGTRDAGVALNRYLAVRNAEGSYGAQELPIWSRNSEGGLVTCPTPSKLWVDCLPDPNLDSAQLELTFLATLKAYDAWDPASSGSWERYVRGDHPGEPRYPPAAPNLAPLEAAARLRLLQGLHGKDALRALKEARQLARLTWILGTRDASRVAFAILHDERMVYEAAVQRGALAEGDWAPLAESDREAAQRAIAGMAALYASDGPPGALERLRAEVPDPVGACAGLDAALDLLLPARGLFTRAWPGEIDLSDRIAALDAAIADAGCPPTPTLRAWQDPDRSFDRTFRDLSGYLAASGTALPELLTSPDRLRTALGLPWIRQLAGAVLLAPSAPYHPYRPLPYTFQGE